MPRFGRDTALLPSLIAILTGIAVVSATAAWLLARSKERDRLLTEHVVSEQVVARTAAAGVVAILEGLASDIDRLSRLPSVRYLEDPARLRRTLDSFLERTALPVAALIRVDTTGRVLFVYPREHVPERVLHALRASGYLARAGASETRLLSGPVGSGNGSPLVAASDLIQPDGAEPLGAIIALFPPSSLASPIQRSGSMPGHSAVLRYADGTLLHVTGDAPAADGSAAGEGFVVGAPIAAGFEPGIEVELRSTREQALAPLEASFATQLFLLVLTNGLLAIGGGFLARELWLRQRLSESFEHRRELERRLNEAQKLESLGRLAGGIAHDFNNTLTVIQGSARIVEETLGEGHPNREEVSAILQASGHAAELTRQLLAFARRQTLRPRIFDLNDALRRTEPLLRRMLPANVRVSLETAPEPAWIRIDPTHLEQIILNLAVNARDAMPAGGELRITAAGFGGGDLPGADGGAPEGYVRLGISDTGDGIPADDLERIFEPFFTTKESGKGTGLGLATVHGIVAQSGGRIAVESRPGAGTRFVVDLPAAEPPAVSGLAEEGGPAVRPGSARNGSGAMILLVEDDPSVRRIAERSLARRGHRIILAENGEDALRISADRTLRIDLLLTDVMMPGLNGRELAHRFGLTRSGTPVIFMSGYMEDEVLRRGISDSRTGFIEKPFTPDELVRVVEAALA